MANYSELIATINDQIKANGNQEITGPVLNAVLQMMVTTLGEGYQFMGVATSDTNPGTPDGNVLYIAIEPGTYSHFGVIVPNGSIGIISNTSSDWEVTLINTYYEIDVDTLMQDSPSSDDIDEAIGSLSNLRRAITVGVPFFGRGASGGNSTVAIAQVKQLTDNEVRVVMLNTGTVDGSNELVPIIKKITDSAGQLSLITEAPTSFIGPLSSLNTTDKGSVVEAINEVNTGLKSVVKPYVVNLTDLLAAEDSQSISTAIGGIDNLNGTVKKNQVIFGTLANGTVAVGIRVLGNKTTLTYFVDSVVGLTVNEVIITNTSGTLTKIANTHAVLTENMVVDNLESDETTLPLSAAQGKIINNKINTGLSTKQDTLSPGTGIEITPENTINVTLDTTVFFVAESTPESPTDEQKKKICLVPASTTEEGNYYTEYVWVVNEQHPDGYWEEFGTYRSEVDLTPYLKKADAETTYQKITDNTLATTAKTIAGAINEVKSLVDVNSYKQYLRKVYESYGAVYNDDTGYWVLNGLTDLTEEDMWDIYLAGVPKTNSLKEFYAKSPIRTTLHFDVKGSSTGSGADLGGVFALCSKLEVVQFYNSSAESINALELFRAFYYCHNLREVVNPIKFYVKTLLTNNMFDKCFALRNVRLLKIDRNVSFQDSPLLSYESLNYLIANAANTAAITVTVHPTTYSYLTGTAQPTEVGGTSDEWQALVTTAQGKQISFAQPADLKLNLWNNIEP